MPRISVWYWIGVIVLIVIVLELLGVIDVLSGVGSATH